MWFRLILTALVFLLLANNILAQDRLKALIIDGQSNHDVWPKTSAMMKHYLESTGLFTVDVQRTALIWSPNEQQTIDLIDSYSVPGGAKAKFTSEPTTDPNFKPDFSKYRLVVSNFGWKAAPWPRETQRAFEAYIKNGGGLVIVHAANNSFGDWSAYNRIIGLGGWGDRNEKHGPYVYLDDAGEVVRDASVGIGGSHGPQYPFEIVVRDDSHPITKGMPRTWLHVQDELYDRLRGPAENMRILATAYSRSDKKGSGRHEPMMLTVNYGKGRVFHTPMGHGDYSQECVGFIVSFQRGAEWAATGNVTQTSIPDDFPTAKKVSQRSFGELK